MWDLHGLEVEPIFPELTGGFLTTGPPGKSHGIFLNIPCPLFNISSENSLEALPHKNEENLTIPHLLFSHHFLFLFSVLHRFPLTLSYPCTHALSLSNSWVKGKRQRSQQWMSTLVPHSSLADDFFANNCEKPGGHGDKCDKNTAQLFTCGLGETQGNKRISFPAVTPCLLQRQGGIHLWNNKLGTWSITSPSRY